MTLDTHAEKVRAFRAPCRVTGFSSVSLSGTETETWPLKTWAAPHEQDGVRTFEGLVGPGAREQEFQCLLEFRGCDQGLGGLGYFGHLSSVFLVGWILKQFGLHGLDPRKHEILEALEVDCGHLVGLHDLPPILLDYRVENGLQ